MLSTSKHKQEILIVCCVCLDKEDDSILYEPWKLYSVRWGLTSSTKARAVSVSPSSEAAVTHNLIDNGKTQWHQAGQGQSLLSYSEVFRGQVPRTVTRCFSQSEASTKR